MQRLDDRDAPEPARAEEVDRRARDAEPHEDQVHGAEAREHPLHADRADEWRQYQRHEHEGAEHSLEAEVAPRREERHRQRDDEGDQRDDEPEREAVPDPRTADGVGHEPPEVPKTEGVGRDLERGAGSGLLVGGKTVQLAEICSADSVLDGKLLECLSLSKRPNRRGDSRGLLKDVEHRVAEGEDEEAHRAGPERGASAATTREGGQPPLRREGGSLFVR